MTNKIDDNPDLTKVTVNMWLEQAEFVKNNAERRGKTFGGQLADMIHLYQYMYNLVENEKALLLTKYPHERNPHNQIDLSEIM